MIPLFKPRFNKKKILLELGKIFDSGWIGLGPQTAAFEKEFAESIGVPYAVGVNSESKARLLGRDGIPFGKYHSLKKLAVQLDKAGSFRRCTWRQGTKGPLTARFARRRIETLAGETLTLLIEWRDQEPEPANYFFISIPDPISTNKLVRVVMPRFLRAAR